LYLQGKGGDFAGAAANQFAAKGTQGQPSQESKGNLGLTNDMLKNIQQPGALHLKLLQSILDSTVVAFDGQGQGYLNSKDVQI